MLGPDLLCSCVIYSGISVFKQAVHPGNHPKRKVITERGSWVKSTASEYGAPLESQVHGMSNDTDTPHRLLLNKRLHAHG